MDYRAALARGQSQPHKESLPTQNTALYRKKETDTTSQTTSSAPKNNNPEQKPQQRHREPKKSGQKQTNRNLDDTWSSPVSSGSHGTNSKGPKSKKSKNTKTSPPEPIEEQKPTTFDQIKALHAERNAALLQRLQAMGASSDDSDDDDMGLYSGENLVEGRIEDQLRFSNSSSISTLSSSVGLTKSQASHQHQVARCSICLNKVKNDQASWQCTKCFCDAFHLSCIINWIHRENISSSLADASLSLSSELSSSTASLSSTSSNAQLNSSGSVAALASDSAPTPSESTAPNHGIVVVQSAAMLKFRATYWQCPNCRGAHERSKAPKDYYCFCGKTKDPQPDPWRNPHTCGLRCERVLECGHFCPDLCHAGRCVPCAVQSQHDCFCGANTRMLRCIDKKWSCGERCGMKLGCGKHRCALPCHEGACPPCEETFEQACQCGTETKVRSCVDGVWQCTKICGASFGCEGEHTCTKVCHPPNQCGSCPLTLPRSCYCGKQTNAANPHCRRVELSFGCGRTCQKPLSCGVHQCERSCHAGECGSCSQISSRYCACGKSKRETPCAIPFKCNKSCELMKSCGRHKCGVRCCMAKGACPPCTRTCDRKLDCGLCTCKRTCHDGPCEPCAQTRTNRCRCGFVTETVPCSPKRIIPHLVKKSCIGGHYSKMVDCGTPPYLDCQRPCGNLLMCGNCVCEKTCHEKTRFRTLHTETEEASGKMESRVEEKCGELAPLRKAKDGTIYTPQRHQHAHLTLPDNDTVYIPPGSTDDTCTRCAKKCLMGYLTCEHLHHGPCHLNDCPPCNHQLFVDCHCMRKRIQYECHKLLDKDNFDAVVKSCHQPCPWKLACSHMCTKKCHSGKCTDQCMVSTRITCKCKTRKDDLPCHEALKLRSQRKAIDNTLLDCSEECYAKKALKDAQKEKEALLRETQKSHTEMPTRARKSVQKDVFNPVPSSSSSEPTTTNKPYKAPLSFKLTKKQKNILYLCLLGFVVILLMFLVYLDKTKSITPRRPRQ